MTGGAGFIGSHLVDSLLRLGCEVVVFDNFDDFYSGKRENVRQHLGNIKFRLIEGSILELGELLAAMEGATVVFHEAAQAGIRYCASNSTKAHEVNVTGTLNVLLAAKQKAVKKVVYASSSSVYGNPIKVPLKENHPVAPTNLYGATKLAAEKYCLAFHETYGLPVVCLRYFSVYGPRGRPDQALYAFASAAAEGSRPTVYGDGSQSRDFTYVSDIVSGTIFAAMADESVGEVFNLGYGKEVSILDVAERISSHFGLKLGPLFKKAYRGDFPRTLCDYEKAQKILRWKPQVRFEDGLGDFLDWFDGLAHRNLEPRIA